MCYFYCGLASRFLAMFLTCGSVSFLAEEKPEYQISPGLTCSFTSTESTGNLSSNYERFSIEMLGITPPWVRGSRQYLTSNQISEQTSRVPHSPKRSGELLLIVPVLHIAKEALQFRYSTYQQFD